MSITLGQNIELDNMNETFLPTTYTVPDKSNGYMKFKAGENRFRVLGSPVLGYVWWVEVDGGRKPKRVRMDSTVPVEFADTAKHFWAVPVWNYEANQVQILDITQKGIQKTIATLAKNPKWGSPTGYDLVVVRTGEGMETEYEVTPDPKEALDPAIKAIADKVNVNLNALFDGADPFAPVSEDISEDEIPEEFE